MRYRAVIAIPVLFLCHTAHAGAGFSDMCETQRRVTSTLVWSENFRTFVGSGNLAGEVTHAAAQEPYVLAEGYRDSAHVWFIIDTRRSLDDAEIFEDRPAWQRRLTELGLTYPSLRNVRDFPKLWWPVVHCWFGMSVILGTLAIEFLGLPLAVVLLLVLAARLFLRHRGRRAVRSVASNDSH
jgi:hypothetical protein